MNNPNSHERWLATWASAMRAPGGLIPRPFEAGFENQSIRQVIHTTLGGSAVRIRLSNLCGPNPLCFESVYVGPVEGGAQLVAGSNRQISFGGVPEITVPVGANVLSDPIELTLGVDQELAISLFLRAATGPPTFGGAGAMSYVAPDNQSTDEAGSGFELARLGDFVGNVGYFLTGIDVLASDSHTAVLAALGDSITAQGWPFHLAHRIQAARPERPLAVINLGIGGNRILSPGLGEAALARFDRDVLARNGVKALVFFEGVNDIGFDAQENKLSAADLIAGHQQVVSRARAAGLTVFGGTITPFKGARYWTPEGETKRHLVNDWILKSRQYDGVIDFAEALAAPPDAESLLPAYDSGDHLHPSEAGQRQLAAAFDLALLESL